MNCTHHSIAWKQKCPCLVTSRRNGYISCHDLFRWMITTNFNVKYTLFTHRWSFSYFLLIYNSLLKVTNGGLSMTVKTIRWAIHLYIPFNIHHVVVTLYCTISRDSNWSHVMYCMLTNISDKRLLLRKRFMHWPISCSCIYTLGLVCLYAVKPCVYHLILLFCLVHDQIITI